MKIFRIWQLPHNSNELFRDFRDDKFKLHDRVCVWWDKWDDTKENMTQLEDIFRKFNCEHPKHYAGHSLSVSDVVEVFDPEDSTVKRKLYYCNGTGWVEIPSWIKE